MLDYKKNNVVDHSSEEHCSFSNFTNFISMQKKMQLQQNSENYKKQCLLPHQITPDDILGWSVKISKNMLMSMSACKSES